MHIAHSPLVSTLLSLNQLAIILLSNHNSHPQQRQTRATSNHSRVLQTSYIFLLIFLELRAVLSSLSHRRAVL